MLVGDLCLYLLMAASLAVRATSPLVDQIFLFLLLCHSPAFADAQLRANPLVWDVHECARGIPEWAVQELSDHSDRPAESVETKDDARRRCAENIVAQLPSHPPTFAGEALAIERIRAEELDATEFAARYTRRGLPVIIEAATVLIDSRQQSEIRDARAEQLKRCGGDGCRHEVRICDDDQCMQAAAMRADGVPSCIGEPATSFMVPNLFSGDVGQTFGGPVHFDHSCDQSLSVQYDGLKRWSLWSPWTIPAHDGALLPPLQLMNGTLSAGDALWFPPGFFHATEILEGPSISAAYFVPGQPTYESLMVTARGEAAARPWDRSPFCYAACGWDDETWRQRQRTMMRLHRSMATPKAASYSKSEL